jgi:hypothetical protein
MLMNNLPRLTYDSRLCVNAETLTRDLPLPLVGLIAR